MNRIFFTALFSSLALLCSGCSSLPHASAGSAKDTQRYARLEVYTPDRTLVTVLEDPDILAQFNGSATFADEDTGDEQYVSLQETYKEQVKDAVPQYLILSYKSPAALINDGELVLISEITVYEDSNIIKEQVSSDAVPALKILDLSEDLMTFYYEADDVQLSFLRSLAGEVPGHS